MQTLVAFIIPVRNDAARLASCLDSIRHQTLDADIVVIDHGSADESASVAGLRSVRVVPAPGAANVATLRNLGARLTSSTWIAFIDADNALGPGWAAALSDAIATIPAAAFGAPYRPAPSPTWVQAWYDGLRDHASVVKPTEWLGAGNLVVRRDAFEAVGGFDESLDTCEDVDLCFRLARAGYTLLHVPGMHSTHHGDPPTLGRLFRSEVWRGRDNIRVSLRQRPMSLRNFASVVIPIAQLALGVCIVVGLVMGPGLGWRVAAASALAMALLVLARAALIHWRARATAPGGFPAALTIAATYESARALALVVRARHHRPVPSRSPS